MPHALRAGAVILTALALVPAGAHLFALPNKLAMSQGEYFVVQQIYRGWALFGIVIFAALAANLLLAFVSWRRGAPFGLPLLAGMAIAASLAVFFLWVYPGNVATRNWTIAPVDWEALRTDWEVGHAVGAALTFLALCAVAFARTGSDHPIETKLERNRTE